MKAYSDFDQRPFACARLMAKSPSLVDVSGSRMRNRVFAFQYFNGE